MVRVPMNVIMGTSTYHMFYRLNVWENYFLIYNTSETAAVLEEANPSLRIPKRSQIIT